MTPKLISGLDFENVITQTNSVTESGNNMLNKYRRHCYDNNTSCGVVNAFVNEAKQYSAFDSGIKSILDRVSNYINENETRWNLASICEGINSNNSAFNSINKKCTPKIEKLVEEYNENDVKSYIKSGILKDCQFIPEVRGVCRNVYGKTFTENHNKLNYHVSTPVSYVIENENGMYVQVNGCTFCISENKIESVTENMGEKFGKVNLHLSQMNFVNDSMVYEYKTSRGDKHSFIIKENEVTFSNSNGYTKTFENVNDFREFIYSDSYAKSLSIQESKRLAQIGTAISEVFENMENIVVLDNVKMFECANGALVSVIESKNCMNVSLYRNYGNINEENQYETTKNAVTEMKNNYSLDVENLYTKRIANEIKENKQTKIDNTDEINIRMMKVQELTEQFKDNPVQLACLKQIIEDLKNIN